MTQADAVQIRRLTEHDADAFFRLRLEGLELEPKAFTESAAEFQRSGIEQAFRNLAKSDHNNFVMGAFVGSELAALAGFYRHKHCQDGTQRDHLGSICEQRTSQKRLGASTACRNPPPGGIVPWN